MKKNAFLRALQISYLDVIHLTQSLFFIFIFLIEGRYYEIIVTDMTKCFLVHFDACEDHSHIDDIKASYK